MSGGEDRRDEAGAEAVEDVAGGLPELAAEAVDGSPDQAWKMLSSVNDWIKHAEAKAAGTMATCGIVAGVLYNVLKDVSHCGKLIWIPAAICVVLILIAGLAAGWALRPRLWSREEPTSNLYFNHIARRHRKKDGSDAFGETIRTLTAADYELVSEIAGQIWSNAHVASEKYRWANIGLCAVLLALIALVTTVLAVVIAGW